MGTTNYVGLMGHVSQSWMLAPLIVFVILIVKLILLRIFIDSFLATAEKAIIMECKSLENLYQLASSAPQEAVQLANKLLTASVNGAIKDIKRSLGLSLTAIESLVLFALDIALGTYACLTVSAVNIAANEAINATESTITYANKAAGAIGKDINNGLNSLSKFINSAVGLISSVESYFSESTVEIKNISLTVNKLNNLSIPTSINAKLESLRSDIPTFNGTKSLIKNEVSAPFDFLKNHLNSSNFTVNLHFPLKNTNATHFNFDIAQCRETNIKGTFDSIHGQISQLTTTLCALLAVAIAIGVLFNVWRARSKWETMVRAASTSLSFAGEKELQDSTESTLTRISYMNATVLERKLIDRRWLSPKQIWWIRYVTMRPLVRYLLVGLSGIFISLLEFAIIGVARSTLADLHILEKNVTNDISEEIQQSFNTWRNETNSRITVVESDINTKMLGWINNGSLSLNSTLTHFSNSLTNELAVFNGTLLYSPLQDAYMCIVGDKVSEVEKGLTWIHRNSQITLPKISNNITLFSNTSVSQSAESIAKFIIKDAMRSLKTAIHIQLIVSGAILSIWTLYAFLAYLYLLFGPQLSWIFRFPLSQPPPKEQYFNKEAFGYTAGVTTKSSTLWKFGFNHLSCIVKKPHIFTMSTSELRAGPPPQSPIRRIHNRLTRFFSGPERNVTLTTLKDPVRGSIHPPDDPATPLKAMIF